MPQNTAQQALPEMTRPRVGPRTPAVGEKMADGTIYIGVSPENGLPLYAMPDDGPAAYDFYEARRYALLQNAESAFGHGDWRLPTKSELELMCRNQACIGGFDADDDGDCPSGWGWYWSSTSSYMLFAWCQRFTDGRQMLDDKHARLPVRLIRG
jgi:hypothetical protein